MHAFQRRHRPVNLSQIGDFRSALEFFGFDLEEWRKDCCHCVVDPDIDRPKFLFYLLGCIFNLLRIRDVYGQHQCFSPRLLNIAPGRLQALSPARD